MRKLCTECGKTKTTRGICGDCKWKETAKKNFKSPYKEPAYKVLGWKNVAEKG